MEKSLVNAKVLFFANVNAQVSNVALVAIPNARCQVYSSEERSENQSAITIISSKKVSSNFIVSLNHILLDLFITMHCIRAFFLQSRWPLSSSPNDRDFRTRQSWSHVAPRCCLSNARKLVLSSQEEREELENLCRQRPGDRHAESRLVWVSDESKSAHVQ